MTGDFAVGDRVVLATEAEHGGDPARVGVVIDTTAVDLDGFDVVAVDFPWSPSHVVLRPVSLELVDRPADPAAPDAVMDAARELGRRIGEAGIHLIHPEHIVGHLLAAGPPPEAPEPAAPVLPPYRMRYLEDLGKGDVLFLSGGAPPWVRAVVLERRDSHGSAHLIVVDDDGDQRGLSGPMHTVLPCPVDES